MGHRDCDNLKRKKSKYNHHQRSLSRGSDESCDSDNGRRHHDSSRSVRNNGSNKYWEKSSSARSKSSSDRSVSAYSQKSRQSEYQNKTGKHGKYRKKYESSSDSSSSSSESSSQTSNKKQKKYHGLSSSKDESCRTSTNCSADKTKKSAYPIEKTFPEFTKQVSGNSKGLPSKDRETSIEVGKKLSVVETPTNLSVPSELYGTNELQWQRAIADIEESSFIPASFKSSRCEDLSAPSNKDKGEGSNCSFGTQAELKVQEVGAKNILTESSLFSSFLFGDPAEREEKYLKRILSTRQRVYDSVSTSAAY